MSVHRVRYPLLALAAVLFAGGALFAAAFFAVVTPDNFAALGWSDDSRGDAGVEFVFDPTGGQSLQFAVAARAKADSGARFRLEEGLFSLPLADTNIGYSTLVQSSRHCGSNSRAAAAVNISLEVDTDGDEIADDTLIYDPAFNGEILCDTWQDWDAQVGIWYSPAGGTFAAPGRPLAHYLLENPGTRIVGGAGGGVSLSAGFEKNRWKGFVGNADLLTLTDTMPKCTCFECDFACLAGASGTYDFEVVGP